jgi:hypothetical protein
LKPLAIQNLTALLKQVMDPYVVLADDHNLSAFGVRQGSDGSAGNRKLPATQGMMACGKKSPHRSETAGAV